MLQTQVIDNEKAFSELEKEWDHLLSKSDQNHFYLTHEFMFTWWKHLSSKASLRIVLVRDNGELIAIAPFMLTRGGFLKFPARKIEFIGSGWGYGGIILHRKKRECIEKIFSTLEDIKNWDIALFSQMLNDPEISHDELPLAFPKGRCAHNSFQIRIPCIPLDSTWEEYLSERGQSFRRNIKNKEKKLNQFGKAEFLRITNFNGSDVTFSKTMGWLKTIADRSWKSKAGTAISSNKDVFGFYTELTEKMNEKGSMDLSVLFIDGKPIAYIYGALYDRVFYEIDIAYDEQYSKASPGVLLRNYILQELFKEDLKNFDFVAYYEYKNELTSHYTDHRMHFIYRKRPYPLFLRYLRTKVLPLAKRWAPSLKDKN